MTWLFNLVPRAFPLKLFPGRLLLIWFIQLKFSSNQLLESSKPFLSGMVWTPTAVCDQWVFINYLQRAMKIKMKEYLTLRLT